MSAPSEKDDVINEIFSGYMGDLEKSMGSEISGVKLMQPYIEARNKRELKIRALLDKLRDAQFIDFHVNAREQEIEEFINKAIDDIRE